MQTLEGRQSILPALEARQRRFQVILVAHGAHEEKFTDVLELAAQLNVPVRRADSRELNDLAHGTSHGGIVAVCSDKPRMTERQLIERIDAARTPALLLLLEGVDDARNLGFTLRTAEAMGVQAMLIKKHLWDFDSTEIARAASGAYERLPLVQFENVDLLLSLKKKGLQLYGCLAGVRRSLYDVDFTRPTIIAVGGEKRGLSGAVREICDGFLTIPTAGGASSLSLSHAGAIVLAEALRQRRGSAAPDPASLAVSDNAEPGAK